MLINCVAYEDGEKLADISIEDISDYSSCPLFRLGRAQGSRAAELARCRRNSACTNWPWRTRAGHQRPKIEEYGDSLFVGPADLEFDGDTHRGRSRPVRRPQLRVVRRQQRARFPGRARARRARARAAQAGPAFVLYALMDAVVDRYFPVVDTLEIGTRDIEARIFSEGPQRDNIESAL